MTWDRLRAQVRCQAPHLHQPLAVAAGLCASCRGPASHGYARCYQCNLHEESAPGMLADAVVPISYALKGARHAENLWRYKSGLDGAQAAQAALRALLLVFLHDHGPCVWRQARIAAPTHLAVVPSGRGRPGIHPLRRLIGPYLALPWAGLAPRPGEEPPARDLAADGFQVSERLTGGAVLLMDDTWTSGGSIQSAAVALRRAGARSVAAVVLGRHFNTADRDAGPLARSLAAGSFRLDRCAVHASTDKS